MTGKNLRWCYRKEKKNDAKFRRRCLDRNHAIIFLGFLFSFLTYLFPPNVFPIRSTAAGSKTPSLLRRCRCTTFGSDCGDDPFTDNKSWAYCRTPSVRFSRNIPPSFSASIRKIPFFFLLFTPMLIQNQQKTWTFRWYYVDRSNSHKKKQGGLETAGKTHRPVSRSTLPSSPKIPAHRDNSRAESSLCIKNV